MDPKRLRSVPLLEGLSKKEIERLARVMDEVDLPAGKELVTEGRFAYEFFIIEQGTARVFRGDQHLADLGPTDFFGEIALLATERRTASVVTTSPMVAIVMTGRDFKAMDEELPSVGERIRTRMRERFDPDRNE
jgi:CRP/FNR family transcriptional regulator, cyclic AMP receptor protein